MAKKKPTVIATDHKDATITLSFKNKKEKKGFINALELIYLEKGALVMMNDDGINIYES